MFHLSCCILSEPEPALLPLDVRGELLLVIQRPAARDLWAMGISEEAAQLWCSVPQRIFHPRVQVAVVI